MTIAATWKLLGGLVAFAWPNCFSTCGECICRKSATNNVLWHIGEDIPAVPNKRSGGVVLGGSLPQKIALRDLHGSLMPLGGQLQTSPCSPPFHQLEQLESRI
eukprot:5580633-Amphidinium_carterae.1